MLKILEVNSEERFNELRKKENINIDYLYICKYSNTIKLSDNGTLKNFSRIQICKTQEEYENITDKEDILYIVNIDENIFKLYFNTAQLYSNESYTNEEIKTIVNKLWEE